MSVHQLIRKKRDGEPMTKDEIQSFIESIVSGNVADSQIGAMLMAMYLQGLTNSEVINLTQSMLLSGERLHWPLEWNGILVDKHSTGGVGDKISLILAPVLAACGLKVPMISGRSLEHTGGTLDKLESIPGFKVDLDQEEMEEALVQTGCFISAATPRLCPADRILYKLRDITCTVDSIGLIVSSIISKKVVSGTKFLVVDVKVGKAAFCRTVEQARALAKQLITVSAQLGLCTRVVLSRMDEPLGRSIGNALEMEEVVLSLAGNISPDIARLVSVLGANLLEMTGNRGEQDLEESIRKVISNGSAMERFYKMLLMQGVEEHVAGPLLRGESILDRAQYTTQLKAQISGWVVEVDALIVGQTCLELGAGRRGVGDTIDPVVGVEICKRRGDKVAEGDLWLTVHHSTPSLPSQLVHTLQDALVVGPSPVDSLDIIIEVIH